MFKKTLLATSAALLATSTFAADIDNTNLDIAFQGAHFQGAGNQITMLRVPVTNKETGQTQFFDMSAEFSADKNGNLIFKNMSSIKSVAFASANQLIAGHYVDSYSRSWYVDGPTVGADGRLIWTLQMPRPDGTSTSPENVQVMSGAYSSNELVKGLDGSNEVAKSASSLNYGVINGDKIASAAQSGKMISLTQYSNKGKPQETWSLRQAPEPVKQD